MIFIGVFFHLGDRQEKAEEDRRHGDFFLMTAARNQQAAQEMFRKRIQDFRKSGSLFEGECRIYLTKILEFEAIPDSEAVMLNFRSAAGDPVMPFIDCTIPMDESHHCTILEWNENVPEVEGMKGELFLEFPDA
ncbi:MAG: hypothetical protein V2I97_14625 [Desulfococcaceae bacterium]|nr:hypothetical protein [Desulfococcaceae bacterium]